MRVISDRKVAFWLCWNWRKLMSERNVFSNPHPWPWPTPFAYLAGVESFMSSRVLKTQKWTLKLFPQPSTHDVSNSTDKVHIYQIIHVSHAPVIMSSAFMVVVSWRRPPSPIAGGSQIRPPCRAPVGRLNSPVLAGILSLPDANSNGLVWVSTGDRTSHRASLGSHPGEPGLTHWPLGDVAIIS